MRALSEFVLRLLARVHREEGQDLAEYVVLLAAVVAIAVGIFWAGYSGAIQTGIDKVSTAVSAIII